MIDLNKRFQPEVVLVHTAKDIHQDHQTVTEEALRAIEEQPCSDLMFCAHLMAFSGFPGRNL